MTSRNIAIVGKMYAGKTTLAEALVERHGYTRVAMAGPLKALAKFAYGEDVEKDKEYPTIDLNTGEIVFKTGRTIYQEIGQTLKLVDRNIWLKCFIGDTNAMDRAPYVVDDVRFRFEAEYLSDKGWLIVKAHTPEHVRIQRAVELNGKLPTPAELDHESEREVDSIPLHYLYDGTTTLDSVGDIADDIIASAEEALASVLVR